VELFLKDRESKGKNAAGKLKIIVYVHKYNTGHPEVSQVKIRLIAKKTFYADFTNGAFGFYTAGLLWETAKFER